MDKKLNTSELVEAIKDAVFDEKETTPGLVREFCDTFYESLEDFRIYNITNSFEDQVINTLNDYLPFRDSFIDLISFLNQRKIFNEFEEEFHSLFEKLIAYLFKPKDRTRNSEKLFDNYRFILYELFLYFISILINHRNTIIVNNFLNGQYLYNLPNYESSFSYIHYKIFNSEIISLKNIGELIKDRANNSGSMSYYIIQTDFLLFFRSYLHYQPSKWWDPHCLPLAKDFAVFKIFVEARKKKNFEDLKNILNVKSKDELYDFTENIGSVSQVYYDEPQLYKFFRHRDIKELIDFDNLETL